MDSFLFWFYSERWSDMQTHGAERMKELKDNNNSLACLKECVRIRALPHKAGAFRFIIK